MTDSASRRFLVLGALSAGCAVTAGAFGAHALRARIEPRLLEVFETAARYQMYHALAMIAVALLIAALRDPALPEAPRDPSAARAVRFATIAGWCFLVGTVLFSGSLYAMALTDVRALGAITPLGGVAFIVGWGVLARGSALASAPTPAATHSPRR